MSDPAGSPSRDGEERVVRALRAIRDGRLVVVADDIDRENEGDLVIAAELASEADLAFMIRHTSGIICAALTGERADRLGLPLMVAENSESMGTAFTVSVDLKRGTTTGVSAGDRARTVRALADSGATAADFARPGHVFPLRARAGGVLERPGHTEAAVDLARLAGLAEAGVIGEIVNDDGSMARGEDLRHFALEHGLELLAIADLVRYRAARERRVTRLSEASLPTDWGLFRAIAYRDPDGSAEHLALVHGDPSEEPAPLVRVHSECITGDVLHSRRCDCGAQLELALRRIAAEGGGVLVYLRGHEGRGIGLAHKLEAYRLQEEGFDTIDANLHLGLPVDSRDYQVGAQILADLGIRRLRLMTNNPVKHAGLEAHGLEVVERVRLLSPPHEGNIRYLRTKQARLGHLLEIEAWDGTLEGPLGAASLLPRLGQA